MRRGDIWTVAGGNDYAGKPRPAVIVQDDSFDQTGSVTLCAFTSDETEAPLFRLPVLPTASNGLRQPSRLMVDKITTVSKSELGEWVGRLDEGTSYGLIRRCWSFSDWPGLSAKGDRLGYRPWGAYQRAQNANEGA